MELTNFGLKRTFFILREEFLCGFDRRDSCSWVLGLMLAKIKKDRVVHKLPSFALLHLNLGRRSRRVYHLNNRSPGASLGSVPSHTLATTGLLERGWNHRPRLNGRNLPTAGGCTVATRRDTLYDYERSHPLLSSCTVPRSVSPLSMAFWSANRSSFIMSNKGTWSEALSSWSKSYVSLDRTQRRDQKALSDSPLLPGGFVQLPTPSSQSRRS